ncbi:unnamed protein product, partial [Medioppia subpectinata]
MKKPSLIFPLALIGGHYWLQTHRRRQRSPTDGPVFGFRSAALFGYDDKDSPPRTDSIYDTCKQAFNSVVGVEPSIGKQPRKQTDEKCRSSGFIVKDESILNGYVITTARAAAQTRDVNIICTDGQRRTGKVVYMEAHLDLALIEVTTKALYNNRKVFKRPIIGRDNDVFIPQPSVALTQLNSRPTGAHDLFITGSAALCLLYCHQTVCTLNGGERVASLCGRTYVMKTDI